MNLYSRKLLLSRRQIARAALRWHGVRLTAAPQPQRPCVACGSLPGNREGAMRILLVVLTVQLVGCTANRPVVVTTDQAAAGGAHADVRDAAGTQLGRLALDPTATGVRVHGVLQGLPPGTHALHVHAVGQCEPPFTSAGPHFNPTNVPHGRATPQGGHAGDLPNIEVGPDRRVVVDVAGQARLEGANSLFDADGAAIVVHAAADDERTDPAGNAGARIACGVITR
jgi:Cu-Zn family superoxide dismutase